MKHKISKTKHLSKRWEIYKRPGVPDELVTSLMFINGLVIESYFSMAVKKPENHKFILEKKVCNDLKQ